MPPFLCYNENMLNIYYGDNTLNKEKFIFNRIDIESKTILIVPDQFSLKAEQNAFEYLGADSLLNLMVADFSSLGQKVISKSGIREDRLIDKYGRHMILSEIIDELSPELTVFAKAGNTNSFVSLMNSMISEMKRYGVTSEELAEYFENGDKESWLGYKLKDICSIYGKYEQAVEGKYVDPEDYIRLYGSLMTESEIIRGAAIWIYGFDTFTPLNFLLIRKLISAAANVNVVITCDDESRKGREVKDARVILPGEGDGLFNLSKYVIKRLGDIAEEEGVSVSTCPISEEDGCERTDSLWSAPGCDSITLVEASNVYEEAERAALYISGLIRNEGYRFDEIAVICNDVDVRGDILLRTLHRWGIPCFADRKRKVLHQPAVTFLMALLDIMVKGIRSESILNMLKSGLADVNPEECELLENYIKEFNIRESGWNREFTSNRGNYSDEEIAKLNEIREKTVELINKAKDETGRRNTAEDKIRGLYSFLEDSLCLREKIGESVSRQRELGLDEGAAETAQSWNMICEVFDQIVRISGQRRVSNETMRDLVSAGLEEMEVGIVPQSRDCVIMGTMQRTRLSSVRALVITGANEGILPSGSSESGLLSRREIRILEAMDINICGSEEMMRQEEQLAMYRMFSTPKERLYVSSATSDQEGGSTAPSGIFAALSDLIGSENISRHTDPEDFIASPDASIPYVADAARVYGEKGEIDSPWLYAIGWYEENDRDKYEALLKGIDFRNRADALGEELAEKVFAGESGVLHSSASRMEKYSACPFAHFIYYGLKAEEQRAFAVDSRDIGNVYHRCLMDFSRMLCSGDGRGIRGENSPWMTISREQCTEYVRGILSGYKGICDGVFEAGGEGEFRMERISDVCSNVAWALVSQVRSGQIREMHFEERFREDISCGADGSKKAVITGAIDRMDVIDVEGDELNRPRRAVRIVDYKTGGNTIDVDYLRSGYKLQLMTYMNAALEKVKGDPAGVYYFKIKDVPETDEDKIFKAYRLEGIVPDNRRTICAMDKNALSGKASSVLPIKFNTKDDCFVSAAGGTLMTEKEFDSLREDSEKNEKRICTEIYEGRIDISPAREKKRSLDGKRINACRYCEYKSICMFDRAFADCRFRDV